MCYACKPTLPPLSMPQMSGRAAPSEPQYFTFDPLPEDEKSPAHRSFKTSKSKRRSRKVLYPPVVSRGDGLQPGPRSGRVTGSARDFVLIPSGSLAGGLWELRSPTS